MNCEQELMMLVLKNTTMEEVDALILETHTSESSTTKEYNMALSVYRRNLYKIDWERRWGQLVRDGEDV